MVPLPRPTQGYPRTRTAPTPPKKNLSSHAPKQRNCYDCGVFTTFSTYLLARGVTLSRQTYDQAYVESSQLRLNLALAILKIDELRSDGQARLHFRPASGSNTAGPKRKRKRRCGAIVGKRLRTETGALPRSQAPQQNTILNCKRDAKSSQRPAHPRGPSGDVASKSSTKETKERGE